MGGQHRRARPISRVAGHDDFNEARPVERRGTRDVGAHREAFRRGARVAVEEDLSVVAISPSPPARPALVVRNLFVAEIDRDRAALIGHGRREERAATDLIADRRERVLELDGRGRGVVALAIGRARSTTGDRHLVEDVGEASVVADETDPHGRTAVQSALSRKPMEVALPAYEPWYPVARSIFGFFAFGVFSG